MKQKETFNKIAKLYNDSRPSYAETVIDWIIDKTEMTINHKLLEIAPGTGQATRKFVQRGFKIHSVELGDALAKILLENFKEGQVTVDVSPFEEWENKTNDLYDVIYCATAFHWIDPLVKYQKCFDLLKEDGYLVLLWHVPSGTDHPIVQAAYDLLWTYCPKKKAELDLKKDIKAETINEILSNGLFTLEGYLSHKTHPKQKKETFINAFFSQSSYNALNEINKEEITIKLNTLFQGLDEEITTDLSTAVYVCKKK